MTVFLRQSTASQSRAIGPFIDDTDFKTAETGLTIANTDIKLVKNGAASVNKNSGGGTHRINGVYGVTFDATDTGTVGELYVSVDVAGALPVFLTFFVLEEAVYDALFDAAAGGYILASSAPTNFGDLAITATTGRVTVGTSNDKTGYSISGTITTLDGLENISAAQINAEVLDVLTVDTFAEVSSVPAATSSILNKLNWLFTLARNKGTQTGTTKTLRNDADSADIATSTVSDDTTTFTRGEWS